MIIREDQCLGDKGVMQFLLCFFLLHFPWSRLFGGWSSDRHIVTYPGLLMEAHLMPCLTQVRSVVLHPCCTSELSGNLFKNYCCTGFSPQRKVLVHFFPSRWFQRAAKVEKQGLSQRHRRAPWGSTQRWAAWILLLSSARFVHLAVACSTAWNTLLRINCVWLFSVTVGIPGCCVCVFYFCFP